MLLTNGWLKKSKRTSKKYLEISENGITMIQNLWDATKPVLRRKFIVIQVHLRKQDKPQKKKKKSIPKTKTKHNLILHLKGLEKEEQITPKVSKRKEILIIMITSGQKPAIMIAVVDFYLLEVFKISRFLHLPEESFPVTWQGCSESKSLQFLGGTRQREDKNVSILPIGIVYKIAVKS